MINLSMIRNMTDSEFVHELKEIRHKSPIIDELCKRVEAAAEINNSTIHKVECPVCMATLSADFDTDKNQFTLEYTT